MRTGTPVSGLIPTLILASLATLSVGCGIQEHNVPPRTSFTPGEPSGTGGAGGDPGAGGVTGASGGRTGAGSGGSGAGGSAMDAGPPPPPGVDLGGTRVPRDKAIVILHFGHSNMLGHGYYPEELRPLFFTTHPRLWAFKGGRFTPAIEPTANPRRSDEGGPGMALLRAAVAKAPDDYHFISIGLGVGSSTTQDWSKGGLYYDDYVNTAKQLKGLVTYGAAVIMLGITDRHLPEAQQGGFADRLVKIVADLRSDLGEPDLPVLHTAYEVEATGELALAGPVGQRFSPLIEMLPGRIKTCAIVPTDKTGMEDDHHFNLAGQKLFADRAIQILVDRGWARWPVK
jgi:hypothetical protein